MQSRRENSKGRETVDCLPEHRHLGHLDTLDTAAAQAERVR
jgi:hypothetical protein